MSAALIGFALGLLGAIPIAGPIGVLVITRGLSGHFRSAIAIACGGALAEAGYAALAFWGLSTLFASHGWLDPIARGMGACVLACLAVVLLRARETAESSPPQSTGVGVLVSFAVGLGIAAFNPTLIVSWTAAVTVVHSTDLVHFTPANTGLFAVGCMLGIVTWFAGLVYAMWRLREHFRAEVLVRIQHVAGWLVAGLAVVFAIRFALYFA